MIFNCIDDMRGKIYENNIKVYPVWKISPLHFKNVGDRKAELIWEDERLRNSALHEKEHSYFPRW